MGIVVMIVFAVLLVSALGFGIRAVNRRQRTGFYDPAAGTALRDSQARTSANGWVGRGGGVGSGGGNTPG